MINFPKKLCDMFLHQKLVRLLVAIVICLGTVASLDAAQFQVAVGAEAKTTGATITLPIVVTAEVAIGAAQLELLYDPKRLRWVGGDAGKLTANTLIDANLLDPGRVKIAFAGGQDVNGTGTIYQATFEWNDSQPGATRISFTGVRAWDQGTGLELATSTLPGEMLPVIATPITPVAPDQTVTPPTPVPTNALLYLCIAILALSFIAAVIMLWRKKVEN